jgi:hypothetical protein
MNGRVLTAGQRDQYSLVAQTARNTDVSLRANPGVDVVSSTARDTFGLADRPTLCFTRFWP